MRTLTVECSKCPWAHTSTYDKGHAVVAVMAASSAWKAHKASNPTHVELAPRHPVYVATDKKGRNVVGMADGAKRSVALHAMRRGEQARRTRTVEPAVGRSEPIEAPEGRSVAEIMADSRQALADELGRQGIN